MTQVLLAPARFAACRRPNSKPTVSHHRALHLAAPRRQANQRSQLCRDTLCLRGGLSRRPGWHHQVDGAHRRLWGIWRAEAGCQQRSESVKARVRLLRANVAQPNIQSVSSSPSVTGSVSHTGSHPSESSSSKYSKASTAGQDSTALHGRRSKPEVLPVSEALKKQKQ